MYLHVLHFHPQEATITSYSSNSLPLCLTPGSLPFVQLMIGTLCQKTLLMLPQFPISSSYWIYIGTIFILILITDYSIPISVFVSLYYYLLYIYFYLGSTGYHLSFNPLLNNSDTYNRLMKYVEWMLVFLMGRSNS